MKILTSGSKRKVLYISVAVNFLIGTLIGIILFYGQMRTDASVIKNGYTYDTSVTLTDFFRLSWINVIWIISIFISQGMLPIRVIHPALVIRGCMNSFSTLYILTLFGVKEAASAALPQCFSALPLLLIFSAELALRYRKDEKEMLSVRRLDATLMLFLSVIAGTLETLVFRLFCTYLF